MIPDRNLSSDNSTTTNQSSAVGSSHGNRRLTFMVGFWKNICAVDRGENIPGPGQYFPLKRSEDALHLKLPKDNVSADNCNKNISISNKPYTWPNEMVLDNNISTSQINKDASVPTPVTPVFISPIWQTVQPTSAGTHAVTVVPNYNTCFQGF